MEAVVNHRGGRQLGFDRIAEGGPHIHGHGFDFETPAVARQRLVDLFAACHLTRAMHAINGHAVFLHLKVDLSDLPRRLEVEKEGVVAVQS